MTFSLKKRSLSFKLILLFILTAFAIIVVIRMSISGGFEKHAKRIMQPHFQQYSHYISHEIGSPPNLTLAEEIANRLEIQIQIVGDNLQWHSSNFIKNPKRFKRHMPVVKVQKTPYSFTYSYNQSKFSFPWQPMSLTLLGTLLVLLILYFMMKRTIEPIASIKKSIEKIGKGDLSHRVIKQSDYAAKELTELASSINLMADDLQKILESKRQLLLAVSHELRSPLTRSKVALSMLENNPMKSSLSNDLNEMEALIKDLLEVEYLNQSHQVLNLTAVDLNLSIQEVVRKHYPNALIKLELSDEIAAMQLDKVRLQFVVKNLIDNALTHQNPKSNAILVRLSEQSSDIILTVINHGNLIEKSDISRLVEPFYRTDPSRQRKTGGYGLGLHLVDKIISAHGGRLTIASDVKNGTVFRVIFNK